MLCIGTDLNQLNLKILQSYESYIRQHYPAAAIQPLSAAGESQRTSACKRQAPGSVQLVSDASESQTSSTQRLIPSLFHTRPSYRVLAPL